MVILQPDGLQLLKLRFGKVGHWLYVLPIEVVFHHMVQHFVFSSPIAMQHPKQETVKHLNIYFVELQIVLAVLQNPQFVV